MAGPVIQGIQVYVQKTILPARIVVQGLSVKASFTNVGGAQATTGYTIITDISGFTLTATGAGESFARTPNTSNRLFPIGSHRKFPHT